MKTISFCGETFDVPEGCQSLSKFELQCDDYNMLWLYLNKDIMKDMPNMMAEESAREKGYKKEKISCTILDQKAKAYKVTYVDAEYMPVTEFIAYGEVNKEYVILKVILHKEVSSTEDLPEIVATIVKI